MLDKIDTVLKNDMCSGCGACELFSSKIKMSIDANGYSRPRLSDDLNNDLLIERSKKLPGSLFEKVCPGLIVDGSGVDRTGEKLIWGNIEASFVGYSNDESIRNKASSGGVITALSKYLVDSGTVDFVISISDQGGLQFSPKALDKGADFLSSCGSKYYPLSPVSALADIDLSKSYAFVGKPCDVSAVRQLMRNIPEYETSIKYLISFMCAGTPSRNSTIQILDRFGIKESDLISFKYRGDGWPGLTEAVDVNGKRGSMIYNDSWGKILNKSLQTRCKVCVDGIGELADIVCADAWESSENGYPSFEEKNGQSLILARTVNGLALINDAKKENVLEHSDFDIASLKNIQPFQYERRISVFSRTLALRFLNIAPPAYIGFSLLSCFFRFGVIKNLKSFVGLLARRNKINRKGLF